MKSIFGGLKSLFGGFCALGPNGLIAFSLILGNYACQANTSTEDLLNIAFYTNSQTPIDLIAPPSEGQADNNTIFVWSEKAGIKSYVIQFSVTVDFNHIAFVKEINAANFSLSTSDLSNLGANTYYWRVQIKNISGNNLVSKARTVYLMDPNVVFVSNSSTSGLERGNRDAPYKTIQSGIEAAKLNNKSEVWVGQGTYIEEIYMRPGIGVKGGHNSDSWERDIVNFPSTIQGPFDKVVTFSNIPNGYQATTFLDGFQIGISTSIYDILPISFSQAAGGVSNCIINASSSYSNNSTDSAIYAVYANAVIRGNVINISTTGALNTYGIRMLSSTAVIDRNKLNLRNLGGQNATGVQIGQGAVAGSYVKVTNNLIQVYSQYLTSVYAAGIATSQGVNNIGAISNNTIIVASHAAAHGIIVGGLTGIYSNNMVLIYSNFSQTFGVSENSGQNPASVQGNFIMGAAIPYKDTALGNLQDQNCLTDVIDFGTNATCSLGVLASPSMAAGGTLGANYTLTTGQSFNNILTNVPKYEVFTADGPDVGSTYDGTTTRLEIPTSGGLCPQAVLNEYVEYDDDATPRRIQAINCTVNTSYIDLDPADALISPTVSGKSLKFWGTNNSNLIENFKPVNANRAKTGGVDTSTNICGIGGVESCGNVTVDIDGNTRVAPFSIGAYN